MRALRLPSSFPVARPNWPGSVPRPPLHRNLGAGFDTEWARSPAARAARMIVLENIIRPMVKLLADPVVAGLDRIEDVAGPAIFAANHASHLDTFLLLATLPERFRNRTVIAAAADYFFDTPVKARFTALSIAAFPVDRTTVSRRSINLALELLADDWSLIIFPEGGRTPDGWSREFRGGASFLSRKAGVPIVPAHIEGTRRILRKGKGAAGIRRSTTHVTFGRPIWPEGIETREMSTLVEQSIAVLADEQATDWWSARRRAADGKTPQLGGPSAGAWRRAWALPEDHRRPSGTRWPA